MDDRCGKTREEPIILSLAAYRAANPPPDHDPQPEQQKIEVDQDVERFWAGRTFAMRRSARRAA